MSPKLRTACLAGLVVAGLCVPRVAVTEEPKAPTERVPNVALYDGDHNHLWNRVHAALLVRTAPDGMEYGQDRLDPLLRGGSSHLLKGDSADRALAVLDEFRSDNGDSLVKDPLKRAFLQRDLWLVANWAARASSIETRRLLEKLAPVIRALALTADEIGNLPDNYAQEVASGRFAEQFDPEQPEQSYLPPELFRTDGPWVCVSPTEGPTAPGHLQVGNPFTNSTFLVLLKVPEGHEATLEFVRRLADFNDPLYVPNTDEKTNRQYLYLPSPGLPQWPQGTEVALVRRMLLIDTSGRIVPSPLTESVQLREFQDHPPPRLSPSRLRATVRIRSTVPPHLSLSCGGELDSSYGNSCQTPVLRWPRCC